MNDMLNKKPPKNKKEAKERTERYFVSRVGIKTDKNGNPITDKNGEMEKEVIKPYTVTGLCIALGYSSREEMLSEKNEKIKPIISTALMKIEEYAEERLFSKEASSGVKLFLSVNFDRWSDKCLDDEDEYILPDSAMKWTV